MTTEPFANRISNTGHYVRPRWTCCACYHELGDIGRGEHDCPNCGHRILCTEETVPDFVTELIEDDGDDEDDD